MRTRLSIVLIVAVGLFVAAPQESSLATSNTLSQKQTAPPVASKNASDVDYKIPSPTIVLNGVSKPETGPGGKVHYKIAFEVTNWKDYPTGVFVEVANPKMPIQCAKSEKSSRLFAQFFDQNRKVMGWNCGIGVTSNEALKGRVVIMPAQQVLPNSAFLLLTDVKTGKQYKSNVVPLSGVQPN